MIYVEATEIEVKSRQEGEALVREQKAKNFYAKLYVQIGFKDLQDCFFVLFKEKPKIT